MAPSISGQLAGETYSGIAESRTHLVRLDRKDWFRWAATVLVCLLLTAGVFSLALPTLRRDWVDQEKLGIAVMGLFALVLLFAVYTAYQQVLITRLRHQHMAQIGMDAALEVLRPGPNREAGSFPHREHTRFHVDLLVKIEATTRTRTITVFGRTTDLSEGGLGIVIPESLDIGDAMIAYLPIAEAGESLAISAVVRHQRGFYHGCEFVNLGEREGKAIRAACAGALPVLGFRHDSRDALPGEPTSSHLG